MNYTKPITIPAGLTAKKIIKDCSNKTSEGTPVLWPAQSWHKDEPFYTSEKTRGITVDVNISPMRKGESWDAIHNEQEDQMLSFAELLYVMIEHEKQTGERMLDRYNWSWTTSRSSLGGLVIVGGFDSGGADVDYDGPDYSGEGLGVCLSRMSIESVNDETMDSSERLASEASLEQRVAALEEWRDRVQQP